MANDNFPSVFVVGGDADGFVDLRKPGDTPSTPQVLVASNTELVGHGITLSHNTPAPDDPERLLMRISGGTENSPNSVPDNQQVGEFLFQAYDGNFLSAYLDEGVIRCEIVGLPLASGDHYEADIVIGGHPGDSSTFPTPQLRVTGKGSVVVGFNGQIATTALDGFLYITNCPGAPTGIPTTLQQGTPLVTDSASERLKMYVNGAWVDCIPSSSVLVRENGNDVGTRPALNFIEGDNVQLDVQDDADDDEIDVKISVTPVPVKLIPRLEYPDELNLLIHLSAGNAPSEINF